MNIWLPRCYLCWLPSMSSSSLQVQRIQPEGIKPPQTEPESWTPKELSSQSPLKRHIAFAKHKITTKDGWFGGYDYAWLCIPSLPFARSRRAIPPFYSLDEDLPLALAITSGIQHALAMLAGMFIRFGIHYTNHICTKVWSHHPLSLRVHWIWIVLPLRTWFRPLWLGVVSLEHHLNLSVSFINIARHLELGSAFTNSPVWWVLFGNRFNKWYVKYHLRYHNQWDSTLNSCRHKLFDVIYCNCCMLRNDSRALETFWGSCFLRFSTLCIKTVHVARL